MPKENEHSHLGSYNSVVSMHGVGIPHSSLSPAFRLSLPALPHPRPLGIHIPLFRRHSFPCPLFPRHGWTRLGCCRSTRSYRTLAGGSLCKSGSIHRSLPQSQMGRKRRLLILSFRASVFPGEVHGGEREIRAPSAHEQGSPCESVP